MAGFPSHPDDVTGDWLAERLREAKLLGNGRITAVRWEAIGTGQVGDSVRFHLEYDAPDAGPATLAGKFPAADPTSRGTAAMLGLYAKEVRFYRDVAPQLEVRVPATYAAEVSEDGGSFILLFEDLAPQRGGNQLEGCSIEDARHAIAQAAGIHAPSWRNPAILELDWLRPDPAATAQIRTLYPGAQALFRERYADTLEPEFMDICERLAANGTWMARSHPQVSLVHGDFRLDNMLFGIGNGAEPIAVLDWQTLGVGHPLTDIGYFLGCGIGDILRRKHETELLDLYCDEMTRRGVPLTRGEIWRDYVLGALHGVSTAVFSAAFVERTPRGDANFLSMARGACALALEHGSLQLLEEG
ncbi:phosphotransferase family protein [Altererythrobacter sp. Z27]|uniref:phosphotransferase family protein n=1 Tax=Altererythrobacter sp. Z27 TaxID=3461147 RepID=UPI004044695F